MRDCLVRGVFADDVATAALDAQLLVDDGFLDVVQVQVLPVRDTGHRFADQFGDR